MFVPLSQVTKTSLPIVQVASRKFSASSSQHAAGSAEISSILEERILGKQRAREQQRDGYRLGEN